MLYITYLSTYAIIAHYMVPTNVYRQARLAGISEKMSNL
jgi:hypothetical protein